MSPEKFIGWKGTLFISEIIDLVFRAAFKYWEFVFLLPYLSNEKSWVDPDPITIIEVDFSKLSGTITEIQCHHSLELSSNAIFNDDLDLALKVSIFGSEGTVYVPISVSSPKIDISSYAVVDGSIEPGAAATMNLDVKNNGDVAIEGLTAEIISSTNLITITNSIINFYQI